MQAVEFANNTVQLTNMGFPLAVAAGALAKHNNNVEAAAEAATDACAGTTS